MRPAALVSCDRALSLDSQARAAVAEAAVAAVAAVAAGVEEAAVEEVAAVVAEVAAVVAAEARRRLPASPSSSVVPEPVKPPAATSVVPATEVPPGNERIWFSVGSVCQLVQGTPQLSVSPVACGLSRASAPRAAAGEERVAAAEQVQAAGAGNAAAGRVVRRGQVLAGRPGVGGDGVVVAEVDHRVRGVASAGDEHVPAGDPEARAADGVRDRVLVAHVFAAGLYS